MFFMGNNVAKNRVNLLMIIWDGDYSPGTIFYVHLSLMAKERQVPVGSGLSLLYIVK